MGAVATESGHWYAKDGTPTYEVPNASKGGMRPTRITDAKKLELVPSVTTILSVKAKPALERWKQNQILEASLTLPRNDGESLDEYAKRCLKDAFAASHEARDRGTAIHGSIERAYLGKPYAAEHKPYVDKVYELLGEYEGKWETERSFAHPLGFGGKGDLHHKTGFGVVVDYKVSDKPLSSKLHWDEHIMQLAAYREGFGIPDAICLNVFVSVTDPGIARIHEWTPEDAEWGWDMFKALLHVWKLEKRFDPSWDNETR